MKNKKTYFLKQKEKKLKGNRDNKKYLLYILIYTYIINTLEEMRRYHIHIARQLLFKNKVCMQGRQVRKEAFRE